MSACFDPDRLDLDGCFQEWCAIYDSVPAHLRRAVLASLEHAVDLIGEGWPVEEAFEEGFLELTMERFGESRTAARQRLRRDIANRTAQISALH